MGENEEMKLLVRPHGQFVAGWVGEMKAPPAGEGVDGLGDDPARLGDRGLAGFEVVAKQNDEGLFRGLVGVGLEAAVETGIVRGGIGWAIIDEGPAEGLAVEGLQRPEVSGCSCSGSGVPSATRNTQRR